MMNHTFLFKETEWTAEGISRDEQGNEVALTGRAKITHRQGLWTNESRMTLQTPSPLELVNNYHIQPFAAGQDTTAWYSDNPAIGRLTGNFIIVDDMIVSVYRDASGQYYGSEYLKQVSENQYETVGVLMAGDRKISSWKAGLRQT